MILERSTSNHNFKLMAGIKQPIKSVLLGAICVASMIACSNTQAVFSEQAYQQAVSLKVESLALMDKATEAYSAHESEINQLKTDLEKAYEYAWGRKNNETTARQWEILINPDRNLLGGFLKRWEQKGSMPQVFIDENKRIIADAFDTVIELESGKRKPADVE